MRSPVKKYYPYILVLIILIAIALRLLFLIKSQVHIIDLDNWNRSNYENVSSVVIRNALTDVHPPLYLILLSFLQHLSNKVIILKLLSLFVGTVSVYFIFLLGKKFYSVKEGLFSAMLLCLSLAHIYISNRVQVYALLFMLTLILMYLYIIMIRKHEFKYKILYWLLASIIIYSHYYGLFLILSIILFDIIKKNFRQNFKVHLFTLITFLPWIPIILYQFLRIKSGDFSHTVTDKSAIISLFEIIGFYFSYSNLLAILAMILFAYYLYYMYKKESTIYNQFLFACLFFPFLIYYPISISQSMAADGRLFIFSMVPAYLLFSRAFFKLPLKNLWKIMLGVLIAITLTCAIVSNFGYFVQKGVNKPVKEIINEEEGNSTVVGCNYEMRYLNYYLKKHNMGVSFILEGNKYMNRFFNYIDNKNISTFWYICNDKDLKFDSVNGLNQVNKIADESLIARKFEVNPFCYLNKTKEKKHEYNLSFCTNYPAYHCYDIGLEKTVTSDSYNYNKTKKGIGDFLLIKRDTSNGTIKHKIKW